MRVPLHRDHLTLKRIGGVLRVQRFHLSVLRAEQVVDVVALYGLGQKRQAQRQHEGDDDKRLPFPHAR